MPLMPKLSSSERYSQPKTLQFLEPQPRIGSQMSWKHWLNALILQLQWQNQQKFRTLHCLQMVGNQPLTTGESRSMANLRSMQTISLQSKLA